MSKNLENKNFQQGKIMDVTEKILLEQGYENTSVNDIIKRQGIAKGTFYHYFPSKESLLDRIIERLMDKAMPGVLAIVDDAELNALDKLNRIFYYSKNYKMANMSLLRPLTRWLLSENNIRFRHKIMSGYTVKITPLITRILEQGKQEGVFEINDPQATAEMILHLAIDMGESVSPLVTKSKLDADLLEMLKRKINAYTGAIERILGVGPGKVKLMDEKEIAGYLAEFMSEK